MSIRHLVCVSVCGEQNAPIQGTCVGVVQTAVEPRGYAGPAEDVSAFAQQGGGRGGGEGVLADGAGVCGAGERDGNEIGVEVGFLG